MSSVAPAVISSRSACAQSRRYAPPALRVAPLRSRRAALRRARHSTMARPVRSPDPDQYLRLDRDPGDVGEYLPRRVLHALDNMRRQIRHVGEAVISALPPVSRCIDLERPAAPPPSPPAATRIVATPQQGDFNIRAHARQEWQQHEPQIIQWRRAHIRATLR